MYVVTLFSFSLFLGSKIISIYFLRVVEPVKVGVTYLQIIKWGEFSEVTDTIQLRYAITLDLSSSSKVGKPFRFKSSEKILLYVSVTGIWDRKSHNEW